MRRTVLIALSLAALPLLSTARGFAQTAPTVKPLTPADLQREITAHKGKIVILNLWATWCGPCKQEFPALVRLYQTNRAKGVDLLTISFDEVKDTRTKVVPFLTHQKLTTGAFINKNGFNFDEGYLTYLEPKLPADEAFALPRTYIFDRKGKLVVTLIGGQTAASFQKAIASAL